MGASTLAAESAQIIDKPQKIANMLDFQRIYSRKKRYLFFAPGSAITVSI